jgi:hypothetical protein
MTLNGVRSPGRFRFSHGKEPRSLVSLRCPPSDRRNCRILSTDADATEQQLKFKANALHTVVFKIGKAGGPIGKVDDSTSW